MSSVPLWEIKRRLDDFGVSYAAIEGDRPALEQLLLEQYTYEEDEYEAATATSTRAAARRAAASAAGGPSG